MEGGEREQGQGMNRRRRGGEGRKERQRSADRIAARGQKSGGGGRVHLTVGNRSGYRGNRSYRSGSVRKKLSYHSLTEPSKPYQTALFGLPVGFTGLPDRFCRFRKPLRQRFF
jgi:hypothetical protein